MLVFVLVTKITLSESCCSVFLFDLNCVSCVGRCSCVTDIEWPVLVFVFV